MSAPTIVRSDNFPTFEESIAHYDNNPLNEQYLRGRFKLNGYLRLDLFERWDIYRDKILEYTQKINLKEEYFYKPEEISKVLYDTYELSNMLCYLNNISSAYQFNKKEIIIIIPSKLDRVIAILSSVHDSMNENIQGTPIEYQDMTVKSVY